MLRGTADLPLHYGKAPKWLFEKMRSLSLEIIKVMLSEYSEKEFMKRISNPYWFQSLGCVLAFDWHSSGLTTTTCAALKEALEKLDFGLRAVGGKGKYSNVVKVVDNMELPEKRRKNLVKASRLTAKIDNNCVQDRYDLYHHMLFFSEKGDWAVIQQGMNSKTGYARRYHWSSFNVENFLNDPHTGICAQKFENKVLNMASKKSSEARTICLDLAKEGPKKILKYTSFGRQRNLLEYSDAVVELRMPRRHFIDLDMNALRQIEKIYETNPKSYEELILIKGVGKEGIRALSLIAQLIYGAELSWKDPAKFSFAHGGKDGVPFPVKRNIYENSIKSLREIIEQAEIGKTEKIQMLKNLGAEEF